MNSKLFKLYIKQIIKETYFQEKEDLAKFASKKNDKEFSEDQLKQIAQNIIMSYGNAADRDGQDGWEKIVDRKIESEKTYGRSLDKEKIMKAIQNKLKDYGDSARSSDLKTRHKDGYGGAN